ncbi:hypothetical protein PIB30_114410, partial [Stylosanthes scabra]|nr:hypothetical protein [Stylosanthes scabra]
IGDSDDGCRSVIRRRLTDDRRARWMRTDLRWRSREEEIGGGWGRNKQIGGDMDE